MQKASEKFVGNGEITHLRWTAAIANKVVVQQLMVMFQKIK